MPTLSRLVDTSILVDYLRGNQAARDWLNRFPSGELALSVVSAAELLAGCRDQFVGWGSPLNPPLIAARP